MKSMDGRMTPQSVPLRELVARRVKEANIQEMTRLRACSEQSLLHGTSTSARTPYPKSNVKAPTSPVGVEKAKIRARMATYHEQALEAKIRRLTDLRAKKEAKAQTRALHTKAGAAENVSSNVVGNGGSQRRNETRGGGSSQGPQEKLRELREAENRELAMMKLMIYQNKRGAMTNKHNNNNSPNRSPNDGPGDEIPMIGIQDQQQKDVFESFLSALKHRISQEYDYPLDIMPLIEQLRDPRSVLVKNRPKVTETPGSEENEFVARLQSVVVNTKRLYFLLWGQCTARLKIQIMSDPDYTRESNKKRTLFFSS